MEKGSDLKLVLSRKQSWHVDGKEGEGALQGEGSAVSYVNPCCNVHLEED